MSQETSALKLIQWLKVMLRPLMIIWRQKISRNWCRILQPRLACLEPKMSKWNKTLGMLSHQTNLKIYSSNVCTRLSMLVEKEAKPLNKKPRICSHLWQIDMCYVFFTMPCIVSGGIVSLWTRLEAGFLATMFTNQNWWKEITLICQGMKLEN
jgi:hypothetical protein